MLYDSSIRKSLEEYVKLRIRDMLNRSEKFNWKSAFSVKSIGIMYIQCLGYQQ